MKNTTLCYIEQGSRCLMLHRTKKANDENEGKWIGVGGKCEEGESPEDCLLREVREETGLMLTDWRYRGLVTFVSDVWPTEYMHLFTSDAFEGTLPGRVSKASWHGWKRARCRACRFGRATAFSCACWRRKRRFSLLSWYTAAARWYRHL